MTMITSIGQNNNPKKVIEKIAQKINKTKKRRSAFIYKDLNGKRLEVNES